MKSKLQKYTILFEDRKRIFFLCIFAPKIRPFHPPKVLHHCIRGTLCILWAWHFIIVHFAKLGRLEHFGSEPETEGEFYG